MLATKIGLLFYNGKILEELEPYRDARVFSVSSLLGGESFAGQTIGTNIYIVSTVVPLREHLLPHEYAHVLQWRKHGTVGFAVRYAWEFISNYVRLSLSGFTGDKRMEAYRQISFEIEASKFDSPPES